MNEGVIKFSCISVGSIPPTHRDISDINKLRSDLFGLGLIGVGEDGIGFGNISKRFEDGFIISASQTGHIPELSEKEYVIVRKFSIKSNQVEYCGMSKPSSESLSHAAIYSANPAINFVIHVHSQRLWNEQLNILPTSDKRYEYGTPGLAVAIQKIVKQDNEKSGIFLTAGHENGIFIYSDMLQNAKNILSKFNP